MSGRRVSDVGTSLIPEAIKVFGNGLLPNRGVSARIGIIDAGVNFHAYCTGGSRGAKSWIKSMNYKCLKMSVDA